jgi:small subunit ribosomal protein S19
MSRSKWKGPFLAESLNLKKIRKQKISSKNDLKIFSRSSVILPIFIGILLYVHNGNRFVKLKIMEDMVGRKFGEFSPTRSIFSYKKKNNK